MFHTRSWRSVFGLVIFSVLVSVAPVAALPHAPQPEVELEPWRHDRVRPLKPGDVAPDGQQVSGMPVERAQTSAAVGVAAGVATFMCPNKEAACSSDAGAFVALTLHHKPEPWFVWGGMAEGLSVAQAWRSADAGVVLTHRVLSGRIVAELRPLPGYAVEPFFGIGLGVGIIGTQAASSVHSGDIAQTPRNASITSWSPFYAARFGADLALTSHVKLGVVADWSNFQALTGENCPWKAFGACSSRGWGAFPSDNAVWKLGMAMSFAFGKEL
jgi:hypothetical protein